MTLADTEKQTDLDGRLPVRFVYKRTKYESYAAPLFGRPGPVLNSSGTAIGEKLFGLL